MNRTEHLLTILSEEASEVTKEVSKCLRFGPNEIYKPIGKTNAERVVLELNDLLAMVNMLIAENVIPHDWQNSALQYQKMVNVEKYLEYSKTCGTLSE